MLIVQITDIHIGFDQKSRFEMNKKRFRQTVQAVRKLEPRPDLIVITGDIADKGDVASYEWFRQEIRQLSLPILMCMGNHDSRASFRQVFPDAAHEDGFIQYVVDDHPLRIVVVDTLEEGRHGGGFCEKRAAWLEARLAEAPDRPTLLVLHHPPIDTGIEWMTIGPAEPWVQRFTDVVSRHRQVVGALCGHVHRTIVTSWAGTTLTVCPSTAPQVVLDLKPMNLDRPDKRPMIAEAPPSFGIHRWNGRGLVSHFTPVQRYKILARYTHKMQAFMKHLAQERAGTAGPHHH